MPRASAYAGTCTPANAGNAAESDPVRNPHRGGWPERFQTSIQRRSDMLMQTTKLTNRSRGWDARRRRTRAATRHTAFTLIELLLVLVILAVLAAVVVPKFTGRSDDARNAAAKSDIATYGLQLDAFEVDNGRYPANDEGLQALVTAPQNAPKWKPYVQ